MVAVFEKLLNKQSRTKKKKKPATKKVAPTLKEAEFLREIPEFSLGVKLGIFLSDLITTYQRPLGLGHRDPTWRCSNGTKMWKLKLSIRITSRSTALSKSMNL